MLGFCLDSIQLHKPGSFLGKLWKELAPAVNCCYGLIMMFLYTVFASIWPEKYRGKAFLQLIQNLCGVVGSTSQFLLLARHPYTRLVILLGLAGDLGSAGLSFRFAEFFQPNPLPAAAG